MARHANGTTDKITNTGPAIQIAISANDGFSYHFFFKGDAAPGTAAVQSAFNVSTPTSNTDSTQQNHGFNWSHTTAAFKQAAFIRDTTTTNKAAQITSVLTSGVWYAIGATWDGSNLRVYFNGSLQATTACTSVQSNNSAPLVSCFVGSSQNTSFCPGTMAEVGYTFGVLNANDMAALAAGTPWAKIEPKNLAGVQQTPLYWPLLGNSPEPPVSGNKRPGGVTGTTVVNHPGVQSLVGLP